VQHALDNLTKPKGSLGRLEEFARRYCAIRREERPKIDKKVIVVLAADHGITEENVSAYPKEVTAQMVFNFLKGGAGVNVLAKHAGADVLVVDIGVAYDFKEEKGLVIKKIDHGTKNFLKGPAMTRDKAMASIECGIEIADRLFSEGYQIIGTGEMGIGNTTPSSAVISVMTAKPVSDVTGRGTGIDDTVYKNKVRVIEEGIKINSPDPSDAVDVLSKVGGFEIGGIAGLIIGASANKIPVVVDGFISGAAALIALRLAPTAKDYLFFSHLSEEKGHQAVFDFLKEKPVLDLSMRLGEGTGAALTISLIEAGVKVLTEMATFDEADVSRSDES
jgi:nicotinate-nucleotide--dimethylbenzimidazole phosphoribosyltransferase